QGLRCGAHHETLAVGGTRRPEARPQCAPGEEAGGDHAVRSAPSSLVWRAFPQCCTVSRPVATAPSEPMTRTRYSPLPQAEVSIQRWMPVAMEVCTKVPVELNPS